MKDILYDCRQHFQELLVSDRRWRKIVALMETAAFAQNRFEIFDFDFCHIVQCIWSDVGDIAAINDWFKKTFSRTGITDGHRSFFRALSKECAGIKEEKQARRIIARCDEHLNEIDKDIVSYKKSVATRKTFIQEDLFLSQSWKLELLDGIESVPRAMNDVREDFVYLKVKTEKEVIKEIVERAKPA